MLDFIKEVLFFIILINPVSKIVLVNMLPDDLSHKQVIKLLVKSSIIAIFLLSAFAFAGTFILNQVFQIDIHALTLAGGIILTFIGFRSLDKGILFNHDTHKSLLDMAIVPLVSPLLAGPGTMAAAIIKSNEYNPFFITIVMMTAILIILLITNFSLTIKHILDRYNLMGALIRITGLFIMAIGLHMMMVSIRDGMIWLT